MIIPWSRSGSSGLLVPLPRLCRPGAIECGISAAALWQFRAFLDHGGAEPMATGELIDELEGRAKGRPIDPLSESELRMLRGAADGLSDVLIAREVGLSPATLPNRFSVIYQKLNVRNRPAAIAEAFRQGLLS